MAEVGLFKSARSEKIEIAGSFKPERLNQLRQIRGRKEYLAPLMEKLET